MSETIPEDILAIAREVANKASLYGYAHAVNEIGRAIQDERERCAAIKPDPDIDGPDYGFGTEAFASGYTTGFWDCHARFVDAIRKGA